MIYLKRLAAVFVVLFALLATLLIFPFTSVYYIVTGKEVKRFLVS